MKKTETTTSILHFADIHFGVEDKEAIDRLAATVERLKPNVSVISGDITQTGSKPEFEAAARWIESLPEPRLICPGNHDTPMFDVISRAFHPFARYERYLAPLSLDVYEDENVIIQSLNTARGLQLGLDWSLGIVDLDQLENKIDRFTECETSKLRFLSVHHPMIYPPEAPLQKTTRNGPEALERLSNAECDAVLSGHIHMPFVIERKPGGSDILSVSAGTLSTRRRGNPASFNHIQVDDEEVVITMIAYDGDGFVDTEVFRKKRSELSRWRGGETDELRTRAKTGYDPERAEP